MTALLIFNPVAGSGRPGEELARIEATLGTLVSQRIVTQGPGDAEAAARAAVGAFDSVLAAGGDGTINEVVNGLLAANPADGPLPTLGLVPLGTQNVFAHELGFPRGNLDAVAGLLRAGKTRAIDIGQAGPRRFALMAGFGFDAAVVAEVAKPVKELIGPAAYAFATLGALAKYRSTSVRLTLDGEEVLTEAFVVVVANAASYAYRQIKMAPFASLDDGWLDVCVFERPLFDKFGFATQILALLARRHLRDPRVRYYRARRIRIESDPPIMGQLDGDMFASTPLDIAVLPRALTVFVP